MARRIRWQIVIAALSVLLVAGLLGRLALRSASVANPLTGGSYSEAIVGQPQQIIPLLNDPLADPAGRDLGSLLFDGLMRIGADGLLEPALAESYQVDSSGEVYTFNLRHGITWHDGTPFNANDVVFTLRSLELIDRPADPSAAAWQGVLVDRIDDYTVRCTLPEPFAGFLAGARLPILPAHLLEGLSPSQWAGTDFAHQLIGTGPYMLRELREDAALLQANPTYFGGRPYIDQVELRFYASPEVALAALVRGDVLTYGERGSLNAGLAALNLPSGMRRSSVPLDEYAVLSFNLRREPFDNVGLRRALAYGLDKDALIERALNGLAVPLDTPILTGSWAYNPETIWYPADSAAAARLLEEQGYELGIDGARQRDGQPLSFELIVDADPRRLAASNEVARQWGELGITVTVQQLDANELARRLRTHDFTLALHGWTRIGPDPDPYVLWHSSQAESGLNYAGLADQQIDDLLAAARNEYEIPVRSADYAEFQQRWVELAPSITLYQPLYTFGAASDLGGVGFEDPQLATSQLLFGAEDRYRTVTRWFLNSYREIQGDLK